MALGRRNRRSMLAGAAIATSRSNKRQALANQQQPAMQQSSPAPAPATNSDDMFVQLEKLGALKDKGLLTQEEFDAKKKQILGL